MASYTLHCRPCLLCVIQETGGLGKSTVSSWPNDNEWPAAHRDS